MEASRWLAPVLSVVLAGITYPSWAEGSAPALRLMPRAGLVDPSAPVPASDRSRWNALAGFPLEAGRRTITGALIVPVPDGMSASQLNAVMVALRGDPEVLWVDDKPRAIRSLPADHAVASRSTRGLVVRTDGSAAARESFAPGAMGSVSRRREDLGALHSVGYIVERTLGTGHAILRLDAPVPYADAMALASSLSRRTGVRYAEPETHVVASSVPNDPQFSAQWSLYNPVSGINAPAAWNRTTGAAVTVAVLDTGILPHPELAGRILPGFDFISDPDVAKDGDGRDNDATDPGDASTSSDDCGARRSTWHGTFVSGIIAASGNNGVGIAGVSWGARILPVRVLGKCGGELSDVIDGMLWAAGLPVDGAPHNAYPAKVLNMSLGADTGGCPDYLQEAIDAVVARGAAIVVAAGNSKADVHDTAPAGCGGVISVAAIGRGGDLTSYSNAGVKADIGAPGGDSSAIPTESLILGLTNFGTDRAAGFAYGYGAGTSFSAPHVAGVLALMLTANAKLAPGQMFNVLVRSSRPYRQNSRCGAALGQSACGAGLLDADAALKLTPPAGSPIAGNLVTVIEFYNNILHHYFMTASKEEAATIDNGRAGTGWSRTAYGFQGYATAGAPGDSSPVCRFYGTHGIGPNSHFYTASVAECAHIKATDAGWTFENVAFNMLLPQGGNCAAGLKPVYRAYNGRGGMNDSNHRYTIDSRDYARLISEGWEPEGVVMCAIND